MADRIIGIGIDIVEVVCIPQAIEQHGKRFLDRIFLPEEVPYANSKKYLYTHLAACWAAKEAVSKALGTGIGAKLSWLDIEICKHPSGEPFIVLHDKGKALAKKLGANKSFISLTHTKDYAAAHCIFVHSTIKKIS